MGLATNEQVDKQVLASGEVRFPKKQAHVGGHKVQTRRVLRQWVRQPKELIPYPPSTTLQHSGKLQKQVRMMVA